MKEAKLKKILLFKIKNKLNNDKYFIKNYLSLLELYFDNKDEININKTMNKVFFHLNIKVIKNKYEKENILLMVDFLSLLNKIFDIYNINKSFTLKYIDKFHEFIKNFYISNKHNKEIIPLIFKSRSFFYIYLLKNNQTKYYNHYFEDLLDFIEFRNNIGENNSLLDLVFSEYFEDSFLELKSIFKKNDLEQFTKTIHNLGNTYFELKQTDYFKTISLFNYNLIGFLLKEDPVYLYNFIISCLNYYKSNQINEVKDNIIEDLENLDLNKETIRITISIVKNSLPENVRDKELITDLFNNYLF